MTFRRQLLVAGSACAVLATLALFDSAFAAATAQEPALPLAVAEPVPPRIPSAAFAKIPALQGLLLSPDGTKLLGRNDVNGQPRVAVLDLSGGAKPITIAVPDKSEIASYRWAGNNRVLVSMSSMVQWDGDEARSTRLFEYDIPSQKARFLGRQNEGLDGDDIVYVDPAGAWILLSTQASIYDYPSVFRVDLDTGRMKEVVPQRSTVFDWYADNEGVVRMGVGFFGGAYRIFYRKSEAEDFHLVAKPKIDDENAQFDLVRIYQGSDDGYVLSNEKSGRYALYKYNLATRQLGEMVFGNPTNDIDDAEVSEDGKTLLYASYTDDRFRVHWFDDYLAKLQAAIDGGLKGQQNVMTSWSRDKNVVLVWTGDSNDPGSFYLFLPGLGKMVRYFVPHPDLKPAELARSQYVTYKARDGLDIPAYLTLPKGRQAKGLSLVILPHGGPFGVRDDLSFDTEVQFLANRGYAVLQPNYRGSGGYGKAFSDKGYGQWGRTMQDDLDDGMDWLVKQGIADAGRVCIVGSSYGGYAALWGAIRNPERYRCAASFAGVTDLKRQLKYDLNFFIAKKYQRDWRDKVRGAEDFDMTSVSPVEQAARLKVPVLIAHGEKDTNVPFKQSTWLVDALKKSGKTYEYYTYPEEGHGFDKPADMKDWLDKLEAFLTKYNPA